MVIREERLNLEKDIYPSLEESKRDIIEVLLDLFYDFLKEERVDFDDVDIYVEETDDYISMLYDEGYWEDYYSSRQVPPEFIVEKSYVLSYDKRTKDVYMYVEQ